MFLARSVVARRLGMPAMSRLGFRFHAGCSAGAASKYPTTMKAVTLDAPGPISALKYGEVAVPALTENKVLVKVHACGVCHRDLLDRQGAFPFMQRPTILGHEIAGVVAAVGPGVRGLAVGNRVASLHWAACGACPSCLRGRTTECFNPQDFLGLTANGGYAEYVVAREEAFVPVPGKWSHVDAASVACTYGTVWHGAIVRGGLAPGERVLITGASGGVGSAAVRIASKLGCHVVAMTTNAAKEPYLRSLGAHEIVLADAKPVKGKQVDMVIECVGAPTFDAGLRRLRTGGRLVLIGNVTVGSVPLRLGGAIINSLSIIGTDSCTADELRQVFGFMERTGIAPHIATVLPLADAAKAHELLSERQVEGRVVLSIADE
eukprot:m.230769 g.230769  ORF g.230769 m.230769 type:complete len:377 (+) comp18144_c0_seq1:55-1185(+)